MFRTKLQIYSLAFGVMLMCASSVYSQAVITISDPQQSQTVGIGPSESFLLYADNFIGTPSVDGLNLFVQTPSAGSLSSVSPTVVNVSGQGVFSAGSATFTPANVSASSFAEASLSIPAAAVPTQGAPFAEIFFDTSGLVAGDQFTFGLDQNTTFLNSRALVPTTSQLTFTANVATVPEPSSVSILFALGSAVVLRRKRG